MNTLLPFLTQFFDKHRQNVKIYKNEIHSNLVTVYDISVWNDDLMEIILAKFPDARFSIETNNASLSGFVLHIECQRRPDAKLYMACLYFFGAICVIYTLSFMIVVY